jgi:hypothetical protein
MLWVWERADQLFGNQTYDPLNDLALLGFGKSNRLEDLLDSLPELMIVGGLLSWRVLAPLRCLRSRWC